MNALAGVWAVTWRSVVFLPVTFVVGVTWLIVGLGVISLPFVVAVFAYSHLWKQTSAWFAVWLVLFIFWRVLRLNRLWEDPPSYL